MYNILLCWQGDLGAIDEKYDVAISSSCGALDHIVVDTIDTAQKCVTFLKEQNIGVATFIGLDKVKIVLHSTLICVKARVVEPPSQLVTASERRQLVLLSAVIISGLYIPMLRGTCIYHSYGNVVFIRFCCEHVASEQQPVRSEDRKFCRPAKNHDAHLLASSGLRPVGALRRSLPQPLEGDFIQRMRPIKESRPILRNGLRFLCVPVPEKANPSCQR